MIEINKIYNGDCLEYLRKMKDKSVDHCLTSPPYNLGRDKVNGKSSKYTNFKDNSNQEDYFNWQKDVITEMMRVTRKHIFYNIQLVTNNKIALYNIIGSLSNHLKEIVIWRKGTQQPAMQTGVLNSGYEFVLIFSNDKPENRMFSDLDFRGTLSNIITIYPNNQGNDFNHRAVMPDTLAEYLIGNFTKENEVILDPFNGVGTTSLICKRLKRNYIGIEIDESYCKIAERRLQAIPEHLFTTL